MLAATLSAGLLIAIGELLARWNIPPFYSQVLGASSRWGRRTRGPAR
ncbi:hypothetical protein [Brachybacterium sp. Z12]|nr:hypothetical protein [Brachybacterium sp. Z12]